MPSNYAITKMSCIRSKLSVLIVLLLTPIRYILSCVKLGTTDISSFSARNSTSAGSIQDFRGSYGQGDVNRRCSNEFAAKGKCPFVKRFFETDCAIGQYGCPSAVPKSRTCKTSSKRSKGLLNYSLPLHSTFLLHFSIDS